MYRFDRTSESGKLAGGGLALYIRDHYDFSLVDNSFICSPDIEMVWIKLSLKSSKPTYICSFYRPPDGSIPNFISHLENCIEEIIDDPLSDILFLGDSNIDHLKCTPNSTKLRMFSTKFNLSQLITQPTRVSNNTSTLIDHIYVNNPELYAHSGQLEPGLSDHVLIFTARKRAKLCKSKTTIIIRDYKHFSQINFLHSIQNEDWTDLFNSTDVNEAVSIFNFIFLKIVNEHMPFRKIRVRERSAPWVTSEFLSILDLKE